jgi:hypothetical protein
MEIEDLAGKGDMEAIKIKIIAFTKLTEDFSQANYRRAGLYGLSAVGVALYQRNVRFIYVLKFLFRKRLSSWKT